MNIDKLIRPHLLGLKPYASARSEYLGDGILLDANENAIGSTLDGGYNRYPDPLQRNLKAKILPFINPALTIHHLFLGNGSDEALDLLIRGFCDPGRDEIMICPPVFGMFEKSAQINNIKVRKVNLTENFQLNVPAIREKIWDHLKVIFICSPNNPSGNLIHSEDIKMLLDSFEGLIVVDEAYIDFANATSWANFIDRYPNLLVMRTFSKAWGMASLRIGLLAGDPQVIKVLNTIKMPYNINASTMELTAKAIDLADKMEKMVAELNEERVGLSQKISWLEIVSRVYPSDANFLLVKFKDAAMVYEHLKARDIIVRNRSDQPLCEQCLRITVGNKQENAALLAALKELDAMVRPPEDENLEV